MKDDRFEAGAAPRDRPSTRRRESSSVLFSVYFRGVEEDNELGHNVVQWGGSSTALYGYGHDAVVAFDEVENTVTNG